MFVESLSFFSQSINNSIMKNQLREKERNLGPNKQLARKLANNAFEF
jgi:hypothetical protein